MFIAAVCLMLCSVNKSCNDVEITCDGAVWLQVWVLCWSKDEQDVLDFTRKIYSAVEMLVTSVLAVLLLVFTLCTVLNIILGFACSLCLCVWWSRHIRHSGDSR